MIAASVKLNGKIMRVVLGVAGCLIVVFAACTLFFGEGQLPALRLGGEPNTKNHTATSNEERLAFIAQFGWEVSEEPIEVEDVLVPEKFDELYAGYNALQKEQGMNLSRYAGKTVKRYCYEVLNYGNTDEMVIINLLVADKKVIGGDVSSTLPEGFVHGFQRPDAEAQQQDM